VIAFWGDFTYSTLDLRSRVGTTDEENRHMKFFIALDKMTRERAVELARILGTKKVGVKVNDLLAKYCKPLVALLKAAGATEFFADVKSLDTDDTVGETAKAWFDNGATVMTVHASGGHEMIAKAVESGIKVYAVTVLTNFDEERCLRIYNRSIKDQVRVLALEAKKGGAHGLICSAKEVEMLAGMPELAGMERVVPGTRSVGAKMHDQKRSATAREAQDRGATGLVIGRELTEAEQPPQKFDEIVATLAT
jgi:orotidine-5'-phosphate decarboxylase